MNRIILVGAVGLSLSAYSELLDNEVKPVLVVSLLPEFKHRHSDYADITKLDPSIPYLLVDNINDHYEELKSYNPDYILVWGWSQLIKKAIIDLPHIGCIGLHPSPLPRNRGRGVIPWTILTKQPFTGVTMFYIDEGVDSGDIVAQEIFPVDPNEDADTLYNKTKLYSRKLVKRIAPTLRGGILMGTPQDHSQATYFAKRVPSDGLIDWNKSAEDVCRLVRASTYPYPGAYTFLNGSKIKILVGNIADSKCIGVPGQIVEISNGTAKVQCGEGYLEIYPIMLGNNECEMCGMLLRPHMRFSSSGGNKCHCL